MIDLNNPDTYTVQDYGNGAILYRDATTGAMYDPNDMSAPLTASDLSQYGAPAGGGGAISPGSGGSSSQSGYGSPSSSPTVASGGAGGLHLSGMTALFTSVGSAFANLINPPKTTPGGVPLVYDSIRGTYIPASAAGQSVTNLSSIPMWVVIGLVVLAFLLLRKKGV